MSARIWMHRHDEIQTPRPYACDVDDQDWLWEGCGGNRLAGQNLKTAETRLITLPEMGGRPIYQVFSFRDKLVMTLGDAPFYLVYDPASGKCRRVPVPAARPIVWYGSKTNCGKLLLFERSSSSVLVLDQPDSPARVVMCPYQGQLAGGWQVGDLIYSPLSDPARIAVFDPESEVFQRELPGPSPEVTLAGYMVHEDTLFTWDTAGGRILPMDLTTDHWLGEIRTPDYGDVYGFLGGGFGFKGKAHICLSTYIHPSRLDAGTGKVIVPEGRLTVDGRPPRFLDRYLVFDPESQDFDYLVAPEQPDGIPLLCYNWTDGNRFVITGTLIPYSQPGVPGEIYGSWIVVQSEPADRVEGFSFHDVSFDRQAHLQNYRRHYGNKRSLYLPHDGCTPPVVNMEGPASDYPPGRNAELLLKAQNTDSEGYLSDLAETIARAATTEAAQVRSVAEFVNRTLYYNPIQVPDVQDPVAILESHDARCGQGVIVTIALLEKLGIPVRQVGLSHHTVAEATYDGGAHIVDALFFGGNQPHVGGRVLSVDELKADPYYADAFPQTCFAYDSELLESVDGFCVLGYVFGIWGSEPYYSYYLGAEKNHPPTFPNVLPAQRMGGNCVRLNWSRSIKFGGGEIEYDVRVFRDRECAQEIFGIITRDLFLDWEVEQLNRMYFVEVRAMDKHREKNAETWYPPARSNFVLVPEDQYGWYGVM